MGVKVLSEGRMVKGVRHWCLTQDTAIGDRLPAQSVNGAITVLEFLVKDFPKAKLPTRIHSSTTT